MSGEEFLEDLLENNRGFLKLSETVQRKRINEVLREPLENGISGINLSQCSYAITPAHGFELDLIGSSPLLTREGDYLNDKSGKTKYGYGSIGEIADHLAIISDRRRKDGQGTVAQFIFYNQKAKDNLGDEIQKLGFRFLLFEEVYPNRSHTVKLYTYVIIPKSTSPAK